MWSNDWTNIGVEASPVPFAMPSAEPVFVEVVGDRRRIPTIEGFYNLLCATGDDVVHFKDAERELAAAPVAPVPYRPNRT